MTSIDENYPKFVDPNEESNLRCRHKWNETKEALLEYDYPYPNNTLGIIERYNIMLAHETSNGRFTNEFNFIAHEMLFCRAVLNLIKQGKLDEYKVHLDTIAIHRQDYYQLAFKHYLKFLKNRRQEILNPVTNQTNIYASTYIITGNQFVGNSNTHINNNLQHNSITNINNEEHNNYQINIEKPADKNNSNKPNTVKTFKWYLDIEKLKKLYFLLNKDQLINSTEEAFLGVFGVGDFTNPIIWNASEALLVYFLSKIENTVKGSTYIEKFAIAEVCFIKANGQKYKNEQLAQTYQNNLSNVSAKPRNSNKVDQIFTDIDL